MDELLKIMRSDTSTVAHSKTWQISSLLLEKLIEKEIEANPDKVLIIDTKGHFRHKTKLVDKCQTMSVVEFMYATRNLREIEKPVFINLAENNLREKDINIVISKLSEYTGHLGKNKVFITALDKWEQPLIKLLNNINIVSVVEINNSTIDEAESRYQTIRFDGFIYGEYKHNSTTKQFDLFDAKPKNGDNKNEG
jgi:hypothetical protein